MAGVDVAEVDRHFARLGEGWTAGLEVAADDDALTAAELEDRLSIPAARIRQWGTRGMLEPVSESPRRYRVGEVRALEAAMRRRRGE